MTNANNRIIIITNLVVFSFGFQSKQYYMLLQIVQLTLLQIICLNISTNTEEELDEYMEDDDVDRTFFKYNTDPLLFISNVMLKYKGKYAVTSDAITLIVNQ